MLALLALRHFLERTSLLIVEFFPAPSSTYRDVVLIIGPVLMLLVCIKHGTEEDKCVLGPWDIALFVTTDIWRGFGRAGGLNWKMTEGRHDCVGDSWMPEDRCTVDGEEDMSSLRVFEDFLK